MQQKLTLHIAGAYLGCKINTPEGVFKLHGIGGSLLTAEVEKEQYGYYPYSECQPILTRLREITKVQASDIALFFKKDYHTYFAISDVCIVHSDTAKEGYKILQISFDALSTNLAGHSEINKYKVCIGNWGSIFVYYNGALSATNEARRIITYCQRNSIDIGYDEIPSLIEAGIAIPQMNGANTTEVDG